MTMAAPPSTMLRALPWAVFAVTLVSAMAGYLLLAPNGAQDVAEQVVLGVVFIGYALVGALIASLRPNNRIGWILIAVPTLTGLGFTAEQYAQFAGSDPSLPLAGLASWLATWLWFPGLGLLGFGLLLFPTGRLASRRWRPVAWLLGASIATISGLFAFGPTAEGDVGYENPLAILPEELVSTLEGPTGLLMALMIVVSAAAPLVRFRRAHGVERDQLKWFLSAAALLAISTPLAMALEGVLPDPISSLLFPIGLAALPIAIGVAILRHRLFDIDLIINRTLVYGATIALLAAVYAVAVLGFQALLQPITGSGDLAVAASTLLVVALFQPLRRRVRSTVDRRFYRSRYDAALVVQRFTGRLRDQVELDHLTDELHGSIADALQPASVAIWIREARK